MVADADADEVGLDVVGGEGERGKQVFVEIITDGHLLVKQQAEGLRVERHVVAHSGVEHETDAVEHHFVGKKKARLEVDAPIGLGDFVGVVVNHFKTKTQPVALRDLEHEVGGNVVDVKILVCAVLLAHVLETEGVLVVGDEMPLAVELEEVVFWAQLLVDARFGWCQVPRKSRGHAENVNAHVGGSCGSVREVGEADGSHPMQPLHNALAVFKREVDGSVQVGTYGVVVEVFRRVELVGEPRQAHAQLEGQSARFVWREREVDERVEGKHLA